MSRSAGAEKSYVWRQNLGAAVLGLLIVVILLLAVFAMLSEPTKEQACLTVGVIVIGGAAIHSLQWSIKNHDVLLARKIPTWQQPLALAGLLLGLFPPSYKAWDSGTADLTGLDWACAVAATGIGVLLWRSWYGSVELVEPRGAAQPLGREARDEETAYEEPETKPTSTNSG